MTDAGGDADWISRAEVATKPGLFRPCQIDGIMITLLLVVQLLVAIALIVVILLQRSEGGALGMGGGGGSGFMTARGTTNLLTRATGILAAVFMALSMLLAILSQGPRERRVLIDAPPVSSGPAVPGLPQLPPLPAPGAPAAPVTPATPGNSAAPTPSPAPAPAQPSAPAAPIAR